MKRKSQQKAFFDAATNVDEEMIAEASVRRPRAFSRKIICIAAAAVAVVILFFVALCESQLLSDMTAIECLEFVESRGVQIPDVYANETVAASFVKDTITQVEEDPNIKFAYSYTVTQALAQEIQTVVNEYYGARRIMCIAAAAVAAAILLCVVISSRRQWLVKHKLHKDTVK